MLTEALHGQYEPTVQGLGIRRCPAQGFEKRQSKLGPSE